MNNLEENTWNKQTPQTFSKRHKTKGETQHIQNTTCENHMKADAGTRYGIPHGISYGIPSRLPIQKK